MKVCIKIPAETEIVISGTSDFSSLLMPFMTKLADNWKTNPPEQRKTALETARKECY